MQTAAATPTDIEAALQQKFNRFAELKTDAERLAVNDSIRTELRAALASELFFDYTFDSLRYLGKVLSDDKRVKVFTWNIALDSGFLFNGYIVQKEPYKVYELRQAVKPCKPDAKAVISSDNWYGALYYRVVAFKQKNATYYLLAGWSRYRSLTQLKVLDVMQLNGDEVLFGAPVFHHEDREGEYLDSRVCFEYDAVASFYLDYNASKRRFEFDHLSPMRYEGDVILTYGPDMSVDAYRRKGKMWVLEEDINAKNSK